MVQAIVEKILREGIQRFAEQHDKSFTEVQVSIRVTPEQVVYKKHILGQSPEPIKFNDLLGVKLDLLMRGQICDDFMQQNFPKYAAANGVEVDNLILMAYLDQDENCRWHLYEGARPLKELKIEEVLA